MKKTTGRVQPFDRENPLKQFSGKLIVREGSPKFPPSVAKTMLDLALKGKTLATIHDPFLGSGVIPIVAYLNYQSQIQKIYGQDISREAVASAKLNMEQIGANPSTYSFTTGNSLVSPFPNEKDLLIVTDPPFGRACDWIGVDGNSTPVCLLEEFVKKAARAKIREIVLCFDQRAKVANQLRNHYQIKERIDLKDRTLYHLVI